MANFVFITEECQREAQRHGVLAELNSLKEKIEKAPPGAGEGLFTPFPTPFLVRKKFGSVQGRLIAARKTVDCQDQKYSVIIFLCYLIRANTDYGIFYNNANVAGQQYLDRIDLETIQGEITECLRIAPPVPLPTLTESHENYIYNGCIEHALIDEEMICESEDWVEEILKPEYHDWHITIGKSLYDCLKADRGDGFQIITIEDRPWKILASYFPAHKKWFLAGIARDDNGLEDLQKRYEGLLGCDDIDPTSPLLTQKTRRMYSYYFLDDLEFWVRVQREILGNFALSEEEINVLNPKGQERTQLFPLFINGRAGSGKSTVLQYLFTDYFCRALSDKSLSAYPAYITCNQNLLDNARKLVRSLIRTNDRIKDKYSKERIPSISDSELDSLFDNSFKEFHSYLRTLIPRELAGRFFEISGDGQRTARNPNHRTPQKNKEYISFSKFKALWKDKFHQTRNANKLYGPDISWHVIRTYIKGLSIDEYLEYEDYCQLDKNCDNTENEARHFSKTVTDETFRLIYEHVWNGWYKGLTDPESGQYWDDQDLVRFLLNGTEESGCLLQPTFAGLFCDESQDFTRIELETILRLSLFSGRKIRPDQIPYIPIAFAGDEFQTLNPTGFRWDTVKAWFTEKFIFALDPDNTMTHRVNFRNLHNNYRSLGPIVRFSNMIQLLRGARFQIDNIEPQQTWNEGGTPVIYFNRNDNDFWKNRPNGTVLIVPCDDGESVTEYIRTYLGDRITLDETGTPQEMTVLSPTEAKGSEYDCVAVYGFADVDVCPKDILTPFVSNRQVPYNPAIDIPMEYFINKVYVSVTRARRQLIVLDNFSHPSHDFFWKFAREDEDTGIVEKLTEEITGSKWKESELTRMSSGNYNLLNSDKPVDMKTLAVDLAKKARIEKNSGLLRQAAKRYSEARMENDSKRCLAEANHLDGKYAAAAQAFQELGDDEKAVDSYWLLGKLEGWKEIADQFRERVNSIPVRFSVILRDREITYDKAKSILKEVSDMLDRQAEIILQSTVPWRAAILALLNKIDLNNTEQGRTTLHEIKDHCDRIGEAGIQFPYDTLLIAQANRIDAHDLVIDLYEKGGYSQDNLTELVYYFWAKAKTLPYPENLPFLAKTKDRLLVIDQFKEHPATPIEAETLDLVVSMMIDQKDWSDFGRALLLLRSEEKYAKVCQSLEDTKNILWAQRCGLMKIVAALEHQSGSINLDVAFDRSKTQAEIEILARAVARIDNQRLSDNIQEQLRKRFIERELPNNRSHWIEFGAVIERGGMRKDALDFYDRLLSQKALSHQLTSEIRKRLIVCCERHAQHSNKAEVAHQLQEKAISLRGKIGIGRDKQLPPYPIFESWDEIYKDIVSMNFSPDRVGHPKPGSGVTKTSSSVSKQSPGVSKTDTDVSKTSTGVSPPVTAAKGPIPTANVFCGFELKRFKERLNLSYTDGRMIVVKNNTVVSDDFIILPGEVPDVYTIEGLALEIRLIRSEDSINRVEIIDHNNGFRISLSLDIPTP